MTIKSFNEYNIWKYSLDNYYYVSPQIQFDSVKPKENTAQRL